MNTIKVRNRILSLALALCLLLGMTLYLPGPVEVHAVVIGTGDDLETDTDLAGTQVYFGNYTSTGTGDSNGPILWHVVETDGNTAVLWTTTNIDNMPYDSGNNHNSWNGSTIKQWLNGEGIHTSDGFLPSAFTAAEAEAITDYGTTEQANLDYVNTTIIDIDQKIVLPSVLEIDDGTGIGTGTWDISYSGFMNDGRRALGYYWWLRSPGSYADIAAFVNHYGLVNPGAGSTGHYVLYPLGLRPAFRLDLSSVLFTSDAVGGKSSVGVANSLLSVPKAPIGAVKLTVLDSTLDLTSVTPQDVNSRTIAFDYTGASAGKTLSAIVTVGDGTVKYYGQLEASTSASGNGIEVTVPDDFVAGDSLQIFVEELHNDYETDYASTPVTLAIAEQTAPTTPQPVAETAAGNDGKITGVDDTMEYRKTGDAAWTEVPLGDTEITSLAPDDYEVRVAGKVDNGTAYLASPAKAVTVGTYTVTPTLTMTAVKTTLTVGEEVDNQTVATADAQNFTGTVTFSVEGTPLPDGLGIDSDGKITITDADALVKSTTAVTVKADDGTDSDTDTVTITIKESDGSNPGPTATPAAAIDSDTLQVGGSTTLHISLGQSGGAPMAAGAHIAVDEDVVAVESDTLNDDGNVTVTAIGAGETDIRITFDGVSGYDRTIHVTVSDSDTPPPVNPPTTSPGGRSSSSSGGRSTPDGQRTKTQLPANAFAWDGRTLTIDHDSITPLGLLSVRWDDVTLTRETDFGVFSGSVIVRFSEDFIAAQSSGTHTVKVEFLNHTGETTVTVGDTGLTTDVWNDNDTHNPNTGGYPDGGYPGATDNPNTGDGRGIWPALLLGSLGAAVLTHLRFKLTQAKN